MMSRQALMRILVASVLVGCGADPIAGDPRPPVEPEAAPPIAAPTDPGPAEPPPRAIVPTPAAAAPRSAPPTILAERVDEAQLRSAPARYHRVSPRAYPQTPARFRDLVYECNNLEIRGPKVGAVYSADGVEIATRWRRYAAGVGGVFVLRDSLWSQQDHPIGHRAYAPMMPPNWVTVAVAAAANGRALALPEAPPIDDDRAWSALTLSAMFGDMPLSESLHRAASGADAALSAGDRQALARNARHVHRLLTDDARAMWSAAPAGPAAVAAAGADRIAASDRAYFGAELRRRVVIPIFVENPNDHEVEEGKGMGVFGRTFDAAHTAQAMRAVYRRRLVDGDLALERYDLSNPTDRRRAIAVLEVLIPPGEPVGRGKVWLWITGRLDPRRKLQGEGPLAYAGTFRAELAAAQIDTSRLKLFAKPEIVLPRQGDRRGALEAAIDAHARHDVGFTLWAFETTRRLEALFAPDR